MHCTSFSSLAQDHAGSDYSYIYSFGAPGHGKGPYDGVGGAFKNRTHQLIKSERTSGIRIPGVATRILDVEDVYNALVADYSTKQGRKDGIGHYHFFLHLTKDNPIPQPSETFDAVPLISKNYQFAMKTPGVLYKRRRSCWCLQCFIVLHDGYASKSIQGCISSSDAISNAMYTFFIQSCMKRSGPGVAITNAVAFQRHRDLTETLTQGDWVIFEKAVDRTDVLWVGKLVSNNECDGNCKHVNETNGNMFVGDILVSKGEAALF